MASSSSSNDSTLKNLPVSKAGSKVKIGLPSLCNYDDDDDDEEEILNTNLKNKEPAPQPAFGDIKPRSGLFSILPPPKANPFAKAIPSVSTAKSTDKPKASSTSFLIPRTIKPTSSKLPTPSSFPKKHKLDEDDEEEEAAEDVQDPFGLNRPATLFETTAMSGPSKMPILSQYNDDNEEERPSYHYPDDDEEPQFEEQQQYQRQPQQPLEFDSDALQKLVGGKRRINEHIEVKDISARDIIGDSSVALTKQITDEYKPSSNKDYFSSGSKRKSQITYLAYVAKEREQELKNEWATSKVNRMQSRMKYGF